MSNITTHDRYIHLQTVLRQLEDEARQNDKFGYHYQKVIGKVDYTIKKAIEHSLDDISDFRSVMQDIRELKQESANNDIPNAQKPTGPIKGDQ